MCPSKDQPYPLTSDVFAIPSCHLMVCPLSFATFISNDKFSVLSIKIYVAKAARATFRYLLNTWRIWWLLVIQDVRTQTLCLMIIHAKCNLCSWLLSQLASTCIGSIIHRTMHLKECPWIRPRGGFSIQTPRFKHNRVKFRFCFAHSNGYAMCFLLHA